MSQKSIIRYSKLVADDTESLKVIDGKCLIPVTSQAKLLKILLNTGILKIKNKNLGRDVYVTKDQINKKIELLTVSGGQVPLPCSIQMKEVSNNKKHIIHTIVILPFLCTKNMKQCLGLTETPNQ